MPRVASLYLPNLTADRLQRTARVASRHDAPADAAPPPVPAPQDDPAACGCPRGGGWRPGARWAHDGARDAGGTGDPPGEDAAQARAAGDDAWLAHRRHKAMRRAALRAGIEALPRHQQPPMRELGRRSEAADAPFRGPSFDPPPTCSIPCDDGARGDGHGGPHDVPPCPPPPVPPPPCDGHALPRTRRAASIMPAADMPPGLSRAAGPIPRPPQAIETTAYHGTLPRPAPSPSPDRRAAAETGSTESVGPARHLAGPTPPADPAGDAAMLRRLALVALRRWSPIVAISAGANGADGLWLDIGGVTHLFGGEQAMARRILRFCERAGLTARLAVAGTAGAAHALARYGPARLTLCDPGGEAGAIAPLPPAALRLEPAQVDAARRLGFDTIGALIASPRGPLGRRFGTGLLARLDQALGRQGEPIVPIVPFRAPATLLRFVEPIATADAIATALAEAMARLTEELSARGLGVRALLLLCLRVDGAEQPIRIGTARATRDGRHMLRLLTMRIEAIEPGFGIEAIRLTAIRTEPLGPQAIDAGLDDGRDDAPPADLAPLIDRIAGRIGARRLYRIGAVESDVPERSVRPAPPLGAVAEWLGGWARPARLLAPPERLQHVLAELPDRPPRRFVWRGAHHRVTHGDGPERIHGEWWRHSGEADAVRDYYQVEDEAGGRFWLYRRGDGLDPRTGDLSWYLHGVFG